MTINLLDCTLRDGAYITASKFGVTAIKGIIKRMQDAHVDIIECGWLKDKPYEEGSSFYHVPHDMEQYLLGKSDQSTYVVMIDWDRYNLATLPECDHKSIDAIRVVFPHGKYKEGIEVGRQIKAKGYQVFFQAANTLAYTNEELVFLAQEINKLHPVALSVVDTFGAMYSEDLNRIVTILDKELDPGIKIGFHSHNNRQLSFALSIQFVESLCKGSRDIIVDSSLCGMGRGAGNTTTELLASYLDKKHQGNYDMNVILDAIDMYMTYFMKHYSWGYSIPYFISGLYCTHVNNIAYLLENHRTNAQDMYNIISSLSPEDRVKYNYDLLEEKYLDNQNNNIDDEDALLKLKKALAGRKVLLIASGKTIESQKEKVINYISKNNPITIGVNAVFEDYSLDYLFFCNKIRYNFAKEVHGTYFTATKRIVTSNIATKGSKDETIVNFNHLIKRGWPHFDNSVITCLRLLNRLQIENVALAGFDGFKNVYAESYADPSLPSLNPDNKWDELNDEIKNMFDDFKATTEKAMKIEFVTDSIFDQKKGK